jgi:prophage regulatory protein
MSKNIERAEANISKPMLMSPKEASQVTTMSRVLLSMMSKEGLFPKPVKIGAKRIAYVRSEVEEWISEKISARAA